MSVTCHICKKETNNYIIYYGSKVIGLILPRIYICEECDEHKQSQVIQAKQKMEDKIKEYIEKEIKEN